MKLATADSLEKIEDSIRSFYFMPSSHSPLVLGGFNRWWILSESGRMLETWVRKDGKRYIFESIEK